jgi:hypothetical protein
MSCLKPNGHTLLDNLVFHIPASSGQPVTPMSSLKWLYFNFCEFLVHDVGIDQCHVKDIEDLIHLQIAAHERVG